jgi:cytochrome P450
MTGTIRTVRDEPSTPAWTTDRLDSSSPPQIEPPYFDEALGAWVLSRHADILAAFRAPGLAPAGPHAWKNSKPCCESSRLKMRESTLQALAPSEMDAWHNLVAQAAADQVEALPIEQPVDVIAGFARPLCLLLAATVTGIDPQLAIRLDHPARQVSAAAADPYDPLLTQEAKSANAELKSHFTSGPETLRDSGFVALSQTLPCILGNAWFALLHHPSQWRVLHQQPELMDQAMDELLRYAGLIRILFRMATEDVTLNGSLIRKGERVILRIMAANRDPERFIHANQLDILRRGAAHLTLGAGPHSCAGSRLIRMGAVAITLPLLKRFAGAELDRPVVWKGGAVFLSPASLWLQLGG